MQVSAGALRRASASASRLRARAPAAWASPAARPAAASAAASAASAAPGPWLGCRALHGSAHAGARGGGGGGSSGSVPADLYAALGVPRSASKDEIKKAYYALAKKYHPDTSGKANDAAAARKFEEITTAKDILVDDDKRRAYDLHGHAGVDPSGGGGGGGGGEGEGMPFDAADLFERFFAGAGGRGGRRGGRASASRRGRDLETTLPLSFMEAVNGCSRSVSVEVASACEPCSGSGSADGGATKPAQCSVCKGSGQQAMQNGFFAALVTCRACGGEGVTIKNPCRSCGGAGTTRRPRTVQVAVPPGVDTGVTMRLPGQGDAGERGGAPGHLYVNLAVEPDPFFSREGADIHVTVPVSLAQAVLGCALTVPTIRGEVELKIPPGSQPSDKLLMRGRGVRRLDGGTSGNQYVHLRVEVPKSLTTRQRELMTEFAATEGRGAGKAGSPPPPSFLQETIDRIKRALAAAAAGGGGGDSSSTGGSKN